MQGLDNQHNVRWTIMSAKNDAKHIELLMQYVAEGAPTLSTKSCFCEANVRYLFWLASWPEFGRQRVPTGESKMSQHWIPIPNRQTTRSPLGAVWGRSWIEFGSFWGWFSCSSRAFRCFLMCAYIFLNCLKCFQVFLSVFTCVYMF